MMWITGKTRVLGIIGSPVAHSLSPLMHNGAIEALGLDYVYVPFPVAPEYLAPAVEGLSRLGVWGFNVTIPHKTAIIPLLDRISATAELCGAVNTVCREGDRLVGHNTDKEGFLDSLARDLDCDPRGAQVLLIGAGGAAQAALAALASAGAGRVVIANRTPQRARDMVEKFSGRFPGVRLSVIPLDDADLAREGAAMDLLVNTTSIGMDGTKFECNPLLAVRDGGGVYDMVYVPPETPLLAGARARGLRCANGAGMLVSQGEAAFTLWTGVAAPPGVMKAMLFKKFEQ